MSTASHLEPEGAARSEEGLSSRVLGAWLLSRMDFMLPEALRRSAPAELMRLRVLAFASLLLFLLSVAATIQVLLAEAPVMPPLLGIVMSASYVGGMIALRRMAAPRLSALIVCATLTMGLMVAAFVNDDPHGSTHATSMMIPILAVYLLGPRPGLLVTAFAAATVGVLHPLYHVLQGSGPRFFPEAHYWMLHTFAALSMLAAWLLGTLHSLARNEAQSALERALKTLHESERKLNSLFENIDDMVCSLDEQGRLVLANTAMRRAFAQRFGKEPAVGQPLLGGVAPRDPELWAERFRQVLEGHRLKFEVEYPLGEHRIVLDTSLGPIAGEDGRPVGMVLFARDITARKEAEARLGELHRTLVDVSRKAGMAEIATGVLHNVGNTLNSVNISTNVVTDRLRHSRVTGLAKAASLLREHATDFATFLTKDPRGQKLPSYLMALSDELWEERDALLKEMRALGESVEHIKSVVSMQQKHARAAGAVEQVAVPQLIDEALRLHAVSFERHGIRIEREYTQVPPIVVDRHKLLQILINLLSNARHALADSGRPDRLLTIRVRPAPEPGRLLIEVVDNGVGIAPENLPRIFTQGFTTKQKGHGFGLHISALAAMEMKGRLSLASPGVGQGAAFTLELPVEGAEPRA
jgi:PAS domain S-box-containing protein